MPFSPIPVWKEAPFIRLLIPFIAGILIQWYFNWPWHIGCYGGIVTLLFLSSFSIKDISSRFRGYWIYGILLNSLIFFAGLSITFFKDGSNTPFWITRVYTDSATVIARLYEPLSQKPKSFKALASVEMIQSGDSLLKVEGNIIVYFQKDSVMPDLFYGSKIIFRKSLQPIKNTGNPGSFDYKRYCAFQQIYYRVYLRSGEYKILPAKKENSFKHFLFETRNRIIGILRLYIPGSKEAGLAEALLIGYKDDLDKNLVQSYTNTGVVHVIAISGLHVGLIYWVLRTLLLLFKKSKNIRWLKPLLVIAGLWVFSLLAGGSPSVLRSAVMFTSIAAGESIFRKISVYNSLAASAFLLLCYNPFWLWDVGFQLSYAAVLSIIIFMKPIYNWWFIQNKILDATWKLNAVTLSAQVLTIPICLYYFHQFPNFFLVTNLIAVPLSSIILIIELLLCLASPVPFIAGLIGGILYWLIKAMNTFIETIDNLPFSVLDNIHIGSLQIICLYLIIICIAVWLLKKIKKAFIGSLLGLLTFGMIRYNELLTGYNQKRLVVYNIPKHQAIDLVEGNKYLFKGDSLLMVNEFLKNFHLKPSRIEQRVKPVDSLNSLVCYDPYFHFNGKNFIILKRQLPRMSPQRKILVDVIIVSGSPKITIADIIRFFACKQVVFDASNSILKITKWRAECDQFGIPYYSVPEKGAFVMNMN